MKRVHVIILGRVHGVGFRYSILAKAQDLGIKGWVKNNEEGVEAIFEGQEEAVKKILEYCKKGPFLSKVDNIKVQEEIYTGNLKSFEMR